MSLGSYSADGMVVLSLEGLVTVSFFLFFFYFFFIFAFSDGRRLDFSSYGFDFTLCECRKIGFVKSWGCVPC